MVMMEKPLMEKPSPIQVGREFVRQYYTLLNHAPELLYRFYSVNSTYVHGGKYCNGEPAEPVIGQKEINCKIGSLKFVDCHTKIKQVDAHSTIGNGVVVQVTGELSNAGNPLRRFMQTFVLAPQGDNPFKFYVHNDIFRYQDEVFMDDTPSEHSDNEPECEDEIIQSPPPAAEQTYTENYYPATAPPTSHTPEQQSTHPLTNGIDRLSEPPSASAVDTLVTPVPEPELPVQPSPEPSPLPEEPTEVIPDSPPSPEPHIPTEDVSQVSAEEPETLPEELNLDEVPDIKPASTKPFSWADMASKNTPARTNFPPPTTTKVQPQVFTPPEPVVEPVVEPQPPRQNRNPPRNNFNNDRGDGGPDMRPHNRRPGGPGQNGPIRYPDNQQVFVGNLPYEINEAELREHFAKFGKVIEVRINYSHTSNPSFGFVIFEDPKSVEEVLHQMPITFKSDRGDHRINIEEKKQRSRDNNRNRGGMGGDQRRMGGGGDMRGGRRGGPPMMRRDRQGSRDGQRQGGGGYMSGPRR